MLILKVESLYTCHLSYFQALIRRKIKSGTSSPWGYLSWMYPCTKRISCGFNLILECLRFFLISLRIGVGQLSHLIDDVYKFEWKSNSSLHDKLCKIVCVIIYVEIKRNLCASLIYWSRLVVGDQSLYVMCDMFSRHEKH